jgi:hypothetical protein
MRPIFGFSIGMTCLSWLEPASISGSHKGSNLGCPDRRIDRFRIKRCTRDCYRAIVLKEGDLPQNVTLARRAIALRIDF